MQAWGGGRGPNPKNGQIFDHGWNDWPQGTHVVGCSYHGLATQVARTLSGPMPLLLWYEGASREPEGLLPPCFLLGLCATLWRPIKEGKLQEQQHSSKQIGSDSFPTQLLLPYFLHP